MSNVEGASKEQQENHVKFKIEEEEIKGHHESLEITELGENKFNVNLGYLKMDHYYRVSIDLKLKHPYKKLTFLDKASSKYITFKEANVSEPNSNGNHDTISNGLISHQVVIVFHVHREKLDKEVIYFSLEDHKDARLELHIEAKVLGVNQGTPLLRNGITLLHHGHQPHSSSTRKISNENIHFNIN